MNCVVRIVTEVERLPRCTFVKATAHCRDLTTDGTREVVHRVRANDQGLDDLKKAEFMALHELVRIVEGWADCHFGRVFSENGFYLTPELGDLASVARRLPGTDDEEAIVFYSVPRRRLDPVIA